VIELCSYDSLPSSSEHNEIEGEFVRIDKVDSIQRGRYQISCLRKPRLSVTDSG
jgi:hypothetical protein